MFALVVKKEDQSTQPRSPVTVNASDQPGITGDQNTEQPKKTEFCVGVFVFTGLRIAAGQPFEFVCTLVSKEITGDIGANQELHTHEPADLKAVIEMINAEFRAVMSS